MVKGNYIYDLRMKLDSELITVKEFIKHFEYQQAEEHFALVEELFEQLASAIDPSNEVQSRIVDNRRIDVERYMHQIEEGLLRREAGKKEDGNIAFKCNWNDAGYKGICSNLAYQYNIKMGGPWCRISKCRDYVNVDKLPEFHEAVCYESRALLDCKFGAGWDHKAGKLYRPRKIHSARVNKIALLTTMHPNTGQRLIVGAYKIEKLDEDPGMETWIFGEKSSCLDDMLEYAIEFWKYYKNPNRPNSIAWATGLFRYVADVAVLGMLEEYIFKKASKDGDTERAEALVRTLKAQVSY